MHVEEREFDFGDYLVRRTITEWGKDREKKWDVAYIDGDI